LRLKGMRVLDRELRTRYQITVQAIAIDAEDAQET